MHILLYLFFGLIVGTLARILVSGRGSGGWVVSIVIGIVGSMVGAFLGQALGLYRQGETAGFVMSVVGAVIVVAAYHGLTGRRGSVV
jgi:uncharacterized membrane protein YeaQ/YmgE (transglycosylase-associated protein family)